MCTFGITFFLLLASFNEDFLQFIPDSFLQSCDHALTVIQYPPVSHFAKCDTGLVDEREPFYPQPLHFASRTMGLNKRLEPGQLTRLQMNESPSYDFAVRRLLLGHFSSPALMVCGGEFLGEFLQRGWRCVFSRSYLKWTNPSFI